MTKRLSDKAIIELAREYDRAKRLLLDAMVARGGGPLEADGVKVQLRTNRTVEWDIKGLAAKLTRAVKARVIVQRVDARALASAVRAGQVDQADVDAAVVSSSESAPFLQVTVRATT